MTTQNQEPFTTRMRRATRGVHSISDSLVNAKFAIYVLFVFYHMRCLALLEECVWTDILFVFYHMMCLALSEERVWAGGLFVFYHIFAYLEDAKERLKTANFNSLFVHPVMYRKKAFEEDLAHYLGNDWRKQPRPEPLHNYLVHLEHLERIRPHLLMAYIYHLYMGLLSGGQILASKRRLFGDMKRLTYYKDKVTDFSRADVPQLKRDLRTAMNVIASLMTAEEQEEFINESSRVFLLNNTIVASVSGQNEAIKSWLWKILIVGMIITGLIIAYKFCK